MFILSLLSIVLKSIFIIIAVIVLLLFILILLPIRYEVKINNEEGFIFSAKVEYILKILGFEIEYNEKISFLISLFGFKLSKFNKESKVSEIKGEELDLEGEKSEDENSHTKGVKIDPPKKIDITKLDNAKNVNNHEADDEDKIEKIIENTEYIFKKLDKKSHLIVDFITKKEVLEAISIIFKNLRFIIRIFLPKTIEGRLRFGTGDVYTEGLYLSYFSLLYPLYAGKLEVVPEWEDKVFSFNGGIRGSFNLFILILISARILLNRKIRKSFKMFIRLKDRLAEN